MRRFTEADAERYSKYYNNWRAKRSKVSEIRNIGIYCIKNNIADTAEDALSAALEGYEMIHGSIIDVGASYSSKIIKELEEYINGQP